MAPEEEVPGQEVAIEEPTEGEETPEVGVRPTPGTSSAAITRAAVSGNTTRALQAISQTPDATPLDHAVAQRFLGLGRFLGLPKIEVVPANQISGSAQYDSRTDTVRIAEGQEIGRAHV